MSLEHAPTHNHNVVIHNDSKATTETLKHTRPTDNVSLITKIILLFRNLQSQGRCVILNCVPSHVDLYGNGVEDNLAQQGTLHRAVENESLRVWTNRSQDWGMAGGVVCFTVTQPFSNFPPSAVNNYQPLNFGDMTGRGEERLPWPAPSPGGCHWASRRTARNVETVAGFTYIFFNSLHFTLWWPSTREKLYKWGSYYHGLRSYMSVVKTNSISLDKFLALARWTALMIMLWSVKINQLLRCLKRSLCNVLT